MLFSVSESLMVEVREINSKGWKVCRRMTPVVSGWTRRYYTENLCVSDEGRDDVNEKIKETDLRRRRSVRVSTKE